MFIPGASVLYDTIINYLTILCYFYLLYKDYISCLISPILKWMYYPFVPRLLTWNAHARVKWKTDLNTSESISGPKEKYSTTNRRIVPPRENESSRSDHLARIDIYPNCWPCSIGFPSQVTLSHLWTSVPWQLQAASWTGRSMFAVSIPDVSQMGKAIVRERKSKRTRVMNCAGMSSICD